MKNDDVLFTLNIPKDLHSWYKKLAKQEQRTLAAQIRFILEKYREENR